MHEADVVRFSSLRFGVWVSRFGFWSLEIGTFFYGLGSGAWDLGSGVWGLGFGIWDFWFGIWCLGLRVEGLSVYLQGGLFGAIWQRFNQGLDPKRLPVVVLPLRAFVERR